METKSLSFPLSAADEPVCLTDRKIDLARLAQRIQGSGHGAVVTFSGMVRDMENGNRIESIIYEAYSELALKEMKNIVREAESRWPVLVALEHRMGEVPVGESSVGIVCAGVHRGEAFEACKYVIDELKTRVPIWKVKFS